MPSKIFMAEFSPSDSKNWSVVNGKHGAYLERDDSYIRLSFDRSIDIDVDDINAQIKNNQNGKVTSIESISNKTSKTDALPLVISLNKDNLNPILVKNSNPKVSTDVLMVTIANGAILVGYEVFGKCTIKSSCKSQFTRAAFITIPQGLDTDVARINYVLRADMENVRTALIRYENSVVVIDDEELIPITEPVKQVADNNRFGFQVYFNKPATHWYITTEAQEQKVRGLLSKAQLSVVKVITVADKDNETELREKLGIIQENPATKVRAITTYGIKLPNTVIRDFKLSYVFAMNRVGEIHTIRSN